MSGDCLNCQDRQETIDELEKRIVELERELELGKCPGPRDCKEYVGMELRLYGKLQTVRAELEDATHRLSASQEILTRRTTDRDTARSLRETGLDRIARAAGFCVELDIWEGQTTDEQEEELVREVGDMLEELQRRRSENVLP